MTDNQTTQNEEPDWQVVHPWFGPCDGNAPGFTCSACANVKDGVVTAWQIDWEARYGC